MEDSGERTIDKSEWGEGPWQQEPDRIEWEHAGLPCLMLRNEMGVWCGYTAVPPGHRLHGVSSSGHIRAHGGVNYADDHAPLDPPGELWWFGFDCGHSVIDFVPLFAVIARQAGMSDDVVKMFEGPTYRDVAYVQAEVNRLAEQLAAQAR